MNDKCHIHAIPNVSTAFRLVSVSVVRNNLKIQMDVLMQICSLEFRDMSTYSRRYFEDRANLVLRELEEQYRLFKDSLVGFSQGVVGLSDSFPLPNLKNTSSFFGVGFESYGPCPIVTEGFECDYENPHFATDENIGFITGGMVEYAESWGWMMRVNDHIEMMRDPISRLFCGKGPLKNENT